MTYFDKTWFKVLRILRVIFYIIFFLSFILINTEYFITHPSFCVFHNHFGLLCPTCGVTRAFSCLMHLNFKEAFNYNPVFTISFGPIFIFLFLDDLIRIIVQFFKKDKKYTILEYLVFGVME